MPFISSMAAGKGGKVFPLGAKPAVVALIALTTGDSNDTFSWSAPNNNGLPITKYGYQTSTDNGLTWNPEVEVLTTSAILSTQYSLNSFKIRVRSFNAAGWSDYSTISTAATVAWVSNTGSETETDTVCGPSGCSETDTDTVCGPAGCSDTETDTVCGPSGCSESQSQNCECGTQSRSRTRTSSRTRTRTRTSSRTRTRTRTSSRTRTRTTQYYSRSGSTPSSVTYGSWSDWSAYSYSAWSAYSAYTDYTYSAWSAYSAWSDYTYSAWSEYSAWSACAGGTQENYTYTYVEGNLYSTNRGYPFSWSFLAGGFVWGNENGDYAIGCGGGAGLAGPSVVYRCNTTGTYTTNDGITQTDACFYISCC